ncbi:MAG: sugar ABC transporter permease [Deinococcota bacterium]
MTTQSLATKPNQPRRARGLGSGRKLALLFVAPAVLLVGLLMYYPMVQAFIESLHATAFLSPEPEFVGLEHYRNMLRDDTFWRVIGNSVTWTLAVVMFQNLLGLASAVLLNQNLPGQGFVRTLVLLPWVLPGVVTALLWRFMYDPQLGLVNSLLLSSGLTDSATGWLAEPNTAMAAVILAAVWKGFPFSMVIFLAALQGVDEQQLEAAQLDGANPWQRFIHVTIPSMSAIIRLNLLLTTIFTFNYFDMIWVTTRGGPLDRTHIFPTEIFELGFGQGRFGEAAAYGIVSVLLLAAFAVLYLRELTQDA